MGCGLRVVSARIYHGRWQDVIPFPLGAQVQAIITDPPYSAKTHNGYRTGLDVGLNNAIGYDSMTDEGRREFADYVAQVDPAWCLVFTDHVGLHAWAAEFERVGRLVFAPVVWIKTDGPPRFSGDGPASLAEYLVVSRPRRRPREFAGRPGHYLVQVDKSPTQERVVGMKRVRDVRRLVGDYSRPGDLILDPFAGTASLGQACVEAGRRYIGSEVDLSTFLIAEKRIKAAQPPLPGTEPDRWASSSTPAEPTQSHLFGTDGQE